MKMQIQDTKQSRLRLMLREKQAFQNANMSVANTLADASDFMNKRYDDALPADGL